ncbi:hypothetical protein LY78DRAFT_708839 [Colletotrichum sublineola]|uniref:DUF7587 domain-containing protein n=1 Tax=Colletotrichum sublineola TaxID=1173701 RepID=A0A066Y2T0_COLSU|nr:hypothetical protein LY78DRAFT_708839 [Colletotrichum sublineola]KDN72366.1 hypothetical protein CSUB01_00049 [Colletotrichum sublineola]
MASVPSITLSVAQYRSSVEKIADKDADEIIGWLTKNTTDNTPWVVRVKSEFYQILMDAFPSYLHFISTSRDHGVVNGTAMISTSHQVHTAGEHLRPLVLYRVTHRRQPNNGIKSRLGRGSDPIFLQLHLQKHLNVRCREHSPFLSATSLRWKALELAAKFDAQGIPGVQIIKFKTSGSGWNHDIQRLWLAKDLLQQFGLMRLSTKRTKVDHEYLVEHSIPEESIVSRLDWKKDKDELDPQGHLARKAAKHEAARKRAEKRADDKNKSPAEKRKADGLDKVEPEPKKRQTGKWVKVGIKVGRNTGA